MKVDDFIDKYSDFIEKYYPGVNINDKKIWKLAGVTIFFVYLLSLLQIELRLIILVISIIVFGFIMGLIGRKRKIGFGKAFVLSVLLVPIVGSIAVFVFLLIK